MRSNVEAVLNLLRGSEFLRSEANAIQVMLLGRTRLNDDGSRISSSLPPSPA